jgi:hypothetical protein
LTTEVITFICGGFQNVSSEANNHPCSTKNLQSVEIKNIRNEIEDI